jgi:SAM-dependent methyltransferase
MERLSFEKLAGYNSFEAAIHMARYLFVKDMCAGKRVLDVACGEGYGAALMAKWGAQSVCGIDVSPAAIASAQANFADPKIIFSQQDVRNAKAFARKGAYDLVVSFETIEHVDDPEALLANLGKVVARNGNIVISCPNDAWYYKSGGSNPFHKSRYTFEEFKHFTESVLGPATSWNMGTFGLGFSSIPWPGGLPQGGEGEDQTLMLKAREVDESLFVPMQDKTAPGEEDISYYLGVWGPLAQNPTVFCGYPVSMDFAGPLLYSEMRELRGNLTESQSQLEQANRLLHEEKQGRQQREDELTGRLAEAQSETERANRLLHEERQPRQQREDELTGRLAEAQSGTERANRLLHEERQARRLQEDELQRLALELRKSGMRRAASDAERDRLYTILDETRSFIIAKRPLSYYRDETRPWWKVAVRSPMRISRWLLVREFQMHRKRLERTR